jgi:hypothetical protein
VTIPVLDASVRPDGKPDAVNVRGAIPVAGIANKSGVAGVDPNTNGACKRGVAGACVIEIVMVDCASATRPPTRVVANARSVTERRAVSVMALPLPAEQNQ